MNPKAFAILLNAPPRAGKDTAAEILYKLLHREMVELKLVPHHMKMADTLKVGAHALFGRPNTRANHYESEKDQQHPDFFGQTPRKVYQDLSEKFMKPQYGVDIFGRLFARRVERVLLDQAEELPANLGSVIICSDVGFSDEVTALTNMLQPENILLLHILRTGCDYRGDTRTSINLDRVRSIDVTNYGTMREFEILITDIVLRWLTERMSA